MTELLNFVMWYLLIGTIFTFFVDLINNWLASMGDKIDWNPPNEEDWGLVERLMSILLWPWAAYVFISAYLKNRK